MAGYTAGTTAGANVSGGFGGSSAMQASPKSSVTKDIGYVVGTSSSNEILSISKSESATATPASDPSAVILENTGLIPVICMLGYQTYTDSTTTAGVADATQEGIAYLHVLLRPGETFEPRMRAVISLQGGNSAYTHADFANGATKSLEGTMVDFTAPDSNAYVDSGANVDHATSASFGSDAAETTLYLEPHASAINCTVNLFRVGDLIRIGNEIIEVVSLGSGADLVNNYLVVKRGLYGSTATTAGDGDAVRFAFFNTYTDFDITNKLRTDRNGRWWSRFFPSATVIGRVQTALPAGLTPGSICGYFYRAGYQEFGLSGITSSSVTGLAVSTTYKVDITVDGGTMFQDLEITTDGSNKTFGGTTGLIYKFQAALDEKFYTTGNLFGKRVIIGIHHGDIRVSSGSHGSDSAISLTDTGDALSLFDSVAFSRIPAVGDLEAPVAARLPEKTVFNPITYAESPNMAEMFWDDGYGNITGVCTGTVDYTTGALLLRGAPPLAEFELSVSHNGALSGKSDSTEGQSTNQLVSIKANVISRRMSGTIKCVTF